MRPRLPWFVLFLMAAFCWTMSGNTPFNQQEATREWRARADSLSQGVPVAFNAINDAYTELSR